MTSEKTLGGSAKRIDPARRLGQVGETWGNALLPPDSLALDELFTFEGEDTVVKVTRVLVYPLDGAKRLFYYESNPQR